MGVYVKQQSQAYDRAVGDTPGSSLGFANGFSYAGVHGGMLGSMLGASMLMQRLGPRRKLIMGAFSSIAVLGNALLFCLPKAAKSSCAAKGGEAEPNKAVSVGAVPKLLLSSRTMRLLFLSYLSAGYTISFVAGTFTADAAARSLGTPMLGYTMAWAKTFSTMSALFLGKISDVVGRSGPPPPPPPPRDGSLAPVANGCPFGCSFSTKHRLQRFIKP
jgi:hypothetical protein